MRKKRFNLSVVIPTINSERFIYGNVLKLKDFLKKNPYINDYEILIAAQTSKDETFKIIKKLRKEYEEVKPLFIRKKGKGIGLNVGLKNARYKWVLMIDDDLPYSFKDMNKLFERKRDNDILIASRYAEYMEHDIPIKRKFASLVYISLAKILLCIPQKDMQAGMKLVNKELFDVVGYPREEGYVWDTEMMFLANKTGFRIVEVPVEYIHQENKLRIRNVAVQMFCGLLRVWGRHLLRKIDKKMIMYK